MSSEVLEISKCPKCGNKHRYNIEVKRSFVMRMMTAADIHEQKRQVRVTRLFTCPTNNEDFEAKFILTDTSFDRIENVSVCGIADE